ncbi:hypothetical protein [Synechococcus sp. CBW1107]|nr:hypothetical protein [Synechococcus sp. CBW1107]
MPDPAPPAGGPELVELPAGVNQLCSCGRSHHAPVRQPWWRWW